MCVSFPAACRFVVLFKRKKDDELWAIPIKLTESILVLITATIIIALVPLSPSAA